MRQYIVGIDLGTTHTVVAYAKLAAQGQPDAVQLFHIEQLVAPGEVAAMPLLPSLRYHAGPGELAQSSLQLPWPAGAEAGQATVVMGQWARQLGAQVPGRLVASAKSWLSHAAVDRQAPILPWGAPDEVAKVSPVEASASYLRHVRAAWNTRFPQQPLEQQDLVLTVPASFDEGARALTLAAAQQAGLPKVRLLEEPQAVFYDWLLRHRDRLADELAGTRLVLVCDVGGGTTDLSLIQVELVDGQPKLSRIGVGKHLMLGGDNMDLALAHAAEVRLAGDVASPQPLSASRLAQLMDRCRAAKELLLAADAPAQTTVTLLGGGSKLVGGSRSLTLTRDEVEHLIVDGFFPQVSDQAQARQARSGLVAFGLPYARDAAITRHLADFLRQHDAAMPDALLLNGGVFRAEVLVQRLTDTLAAWRGAPLRLLHNDNPDLAVARGAVAYALAQQGLAPKIGGGSARSYFLQLDDTKDAKAKAQGICLLPRGSEPGREVLLNGRSFALRVGQPVRFQLFSAISNAHQAPAQAGELVVLDDDQFVRLPPIVMVLQAPSNTAAPDPVHTGRQEIAVQLATSLTEVGTLEMHCVSVADPSQRWRLEFDLRHGKALADETASPEDKRAAARMAEAISQIDRIFGTNKQAVSPKDVTQLRLQLERLLGDRALWTTPVLRQLYDALWQRGRGRRRSAAHERAWLNLAGFCLRPGFGDVLDEWRVQQLWPQHALGTQHTNDKQVGTEWWTLWRRVAGGLAAPEQLRLLDDFAFNLQINEKGEGKGDDEPLAAKPVPGSSADMLRLGAALERIPQAYKTEIGSWLLGRVSKALASKKARSESELANDSLSLWALGRIGARQPVHGSTHDVVPAEVAASWVEALLALDWKRLEAAAFAAVQLARVTDDRARDLPLPLREKIMAKLTVVHAPPAWVALVRERVELDEATERRVLGEALPPGLKLMA
ncbi:Hsp70 family protein [Polaromonas sp. SM01]|uniref:Hsp70 family protein n=1 Tax=Polaromonas sp. SM01 TaxID=3085630 RepID=UPI00298222FD|nr:Hsp70 family protein [Polaromonas sp. SM01]MDW5441597.1 Hsp70 family protein [Polaromonas sp. SM01]